MLTAPFPYFGGKRRAAHTVWQRFGDVGAYVEPFFGSGAVLLARPNPSGKEVVNDADGLLCNFWRAVKHDPSAVAEHADYPVSEIDLHARRDALMNAADGLTERLRADVTAYDPKLAGWWVWGACQWIGKGWCDLASDQMPRASDLGIGLDKGSLTGQQRTKYITEYIFTLQNRLRDTKILCGDWSRCCSRSVLRPSAQAKPTGIFLDPPYADGDAQYAGGNDRTLTHDVAEWAASIGDDPRYRIALCGYEGTLDVPDTWTVHRWKADGGYGVQGNGAGRANAHRETIWFSPHCRQPEHTLFSHTEADA